MALRLAQQRDLVPSLLDQQIDEFAARGRVADHEHGRHAIAQIMLCNKRFEHFRFDAGRAARLLAGVGVCVCASSDFGFFAAFLRQVFVDTDDFIRLLAQLRFDIDHCRRLSPHDFIAIVETALFRCQRAFDMRREIRLVTEMPAAAHHREVHAHAPAKRDDGQNIDVALAAHFDGLLMQHRRQRTHLIAHSRCLLELQFAGESVHLLLEFVHHFRLPSEQEARRVRHIACVIFFADRGNARAVHRPI